MVYEIILTKSANKELTSVPKIYYLKIRRAIDKLAEDPRPAGYIKLKNRNNQYRIRVGTYRIIYSIYDDILVIDVISIGHRKDIYQ